MCRSWSWCRSEEDTGSRSVEELVRFKDTNTKGQWEEEGCTSEAEDELMRGGSELKVRQAPSVALAP